MASVAAPVSESLKGRTVIATSGSRGIGRAIAERLADAGSRVVVAAGSEVSPRNR